MILGAPLYFTIQLPLPKTENLRKLSFCYDGAINCGTHYLHADMRDSNIFSTFINAIDAYIF
jgi:hypothetical protein